MVLDGSKDGSAEIAYESGEYVKILDSDDWVERMLSVGWWTALKRKGRSLPDRRDGRSMKTATTLM